MGKENASINRESDPAGGLLRNRYRLVLRRTRTVAIVDNGSLLKSKKIHVLEVSCVTRTYICETKMPWYADSDAPMDHFSDMDQFSVQMGLLFFVVLDSVFTAIFRISISYARNHRVIP